MKRTYLFTCIVTVCLALFSSAFGQDKEVTVTGTVVDTGGNPIPEALVILISDTSDIVNSTDTVFSSSDGTINKVILVDQSALGIIYGAIKDDYQPTYGFGIILMGNVNLGDIVLEPIGNPDTITVTGTVVDSVTGDPVENALVVLSSINIMRPDSVFTDADGKFSSQVEITADPDPVIEEQVVYVINKDEYETKTGTQPVGQDPLDLGTILIAKINTSVKYSKTTGPGKMPNNVTVYSLKGQQLYSGTELNLRRIFPYTIAKSQPVIVCYKLNNTVLYKKKVTIIR